MQAVLFIIAAFLIVALVGWLYMQTGWYNIAASVEHEGLAGQIIEETMEKSVRHHAKGIEPPVAMDDPDMLKVGFIHFDAMCVGCHGAPGVSRSEAGAGLYPQPSSLSLAKDEWTPSEIYWITKNGIKFTGMPAFGKTHDDNELWAVVAFVLSLPEMDPKQYLDMRRDLLVPYGTTEVPMESDTTMPMRMPSHHPDDGHMH